MSASDNSLEEELSIYLIVTVPNISAYLKVIVAFGDVSVIVTVFISLSLSTYPEILIAP